MYSANRKLNLICNAVDNWFDDVQLNEPVSHFKLDDDREALATISKTIIDWFKFPVPHLTIDGIHDDMCSSSSDEQQQPDMDIIEQHIRNSAGAPSIGKLSLRAKIRNKTRGNKKNGSTSSSVSTSSSSSSASNISRNRDKESESLDSLAKDLETLLEDPTDNYFYFVTYNDEEHALLDETIGNFCVSYATLDSDGLASVVVKSSNEFRPDQESNVRRKKPDLRTVVTPTPIDHRYLPEIRTKPLALSAKPTHSDRNRRLRDSSFLNIDGLKKFEKFAKIEFSDKYRLLSMGGN